MTTTCPTCNGELLTSNGQTFCPACLMQQGMKSSTYGGGPRVAWKPPEIEQLTAAFPHLEIQQLLGVGGMGAVFKVRQKELDRIAALKVLPGEMAADAGFTERFLREARLLASLSHPHIVTVYEFGQRDGIYFLLMEFIDGVTLRQALRAEPIKKLGSKETLAIVGQLCDALQFAHDEGVVHRDIKPENILIDKRGRVKIADFGLARLLGQSPTMPTLTRTHQLMGTPAYMAPEQIEGLPGIDHRADIYSMGVVFYELLTGELPLGRFSPPSERAETDVRLDEVVLRTLAREPGRRYQQASQVKTDVEALRGPAVAVNPFELPAKRRWIGKGVAGFIAGILTALFIAVLIVVWLERIVSANVDSSLAQARASGRAEGEEMARQAQLRAQLQTQNDMAGSSGMMSGMEGSMSSAGFDPGTENLFEADTALFNAGSFNLTDEQRAAVNAILKESHERYLKEEALHSIVSVDANGVQTTEISAFPDQLRAIENEMWTKLDDAVPVETQKEFRNRLNLYSIDGPNDDSGSMGMSGYGGGPGMGMAPGMASAMGGGMGMPGGMMGGSPGRGPGLLGWEAEHYPLKIKISRSGRWFDWSVVSDKSNSDIRAVHELDQGKAPTLPSALRRFYREPGPWMAVANARATYAAKDWMKLADYFTAEAMTREFLDSLVCTDLIRSQLKQVDEASRENVVDPLITRMLQEAGESRGLQEMISYHMVNRGEGTKELHLQFDKLATALQEVPLSEVDLTIQRASEEAKNDRLQDRFILGLLIKAALNDQQYAFDLIHGEVSSYTETGDTASATLTIPNKPPVPIRFQRENGQWRIDAIGSNERLLERLKQTKIWKQHAEIEAVLQNASTAYAAKEWEKLADCFTHTGRVCWAKYGLDANSKLIGKQPASSTLQEDIQAELQALVPSYESFEASDIAVMNSTAFDRLIARACVARQEDMRNAFAQATELLSEEFSRTFLTSKLILCRNEFQLSSMKLSDVQVSGDIASGILFSDASTRVAVTFYREAGQWKFDLVSSPEELQSMMLKHLAKRLDPILADVIYSYQNGAWLVASERLSTRGQLCWLLEAEFRVLEAQAGLSPAVEKRRVGVREIVVEGMKHLNTVDPASMEEFDLLRSKLATATIEEIEQLLASFCIVTPPEKIQARFTVAFADLGACGLRCEPHERTSKEVKVLATDPQTKIIASFAESDALVCYTIDEDKWKIDSLGSLEQLQQHARLFLQRQADSPRAVVETFREAVADGRFRTALSCMSEDARNEWLGEMMIGCLLVNPESGEAANSKVRYSGDEVRIIRSTPNLPLDDLLSNWQEAIELPTETLSRGDRRRVAIELGKEIMEKSPWNLMPPILSTRFGGSPDAFGSALWGKLEEIPAHADSVGDNTQMKYRLKPASPDQPPLELDIIQVDGLWKLNTIIDPALKPWPLPTEEPTPPAEATPVDGATGVP
jgi:hypothetical protein